MNLDHINSLLDDSPKPEQLFDKDGNPVVERTYRLVMSKEAVAIAIRQGWSFRTVYRRDSNSELVPEVIFDVPDASS